jgi:large subunit ribosomal protein L4
MKLKVYTADGSSFEEREFPGFPQLDGSKGLAALRQVIIANQANKRQGNAQAKTRAEVSGSGKKPFRQKGTGRARQGEARSPLYRKGGVVFGPRPRDYSQKVNRKMNRLAFQRALSDRAMDGGVAVIESFTVTAPKTKQMVKVVDTCLPKGKILLVDDRFEDNTALAARNIERVTLTEAARLSVLEVARFRQILVSEKAIQTVIARANGGLV